MKRNADNKHPPNFLRRPKPEKRRPPNTAGGEGSCPRPPPAPRPEPRNAGRRQWEPEHDTASEQPPPPPARAGAPTAPLRPGDLPSLPVPPSTAPSRRSGSGFGYRTPERRRPWHSDRSSAHFVPRQNPVRAPLLLLLPGTIPASPAREPPVPQRGQKPLSSLKAGGATALPRGAGLTLQGGENYSPFYSQLHRSSRVGEPRSADPVGGRCGTRGHSPRRSHAGASRVKAAGADKLCRGRGWSRTRHTDTPSAAPPVLARRELPLKEILIFQPSRSWRKASKREPSIQRGAAPCQQPPAADAAAPPRRARFHGALTLKPTEGG